MGCEAQAFACAQRVGEFKFAGLAIDRLRYQRLIGEPHDNIARECCDGWVRAVDFSVGTDRLDAVEIVGISKVGGDNVTDVGPIARDSPVEVPEPFQRDIGRCPCSAARGDGLALSHDS